MPAQCFVLQQLFAQHAVELSDLVQVALLLEHGEALQGDATGQRVAHEGGAVHEGMQRRLADEGVVYPVGGQGGRMAEVTAGQALGEHHDVRRHAGMVGGKQLAGATEAGGHLVEHQQHVELVAQLPRAAQIERRGHVEAAGGLQQRLHQQRGDLAVVAFEHAAQGGQVPRHLVGSGVVRGSRRGREVVAGQIPGKQAVHALFGIAYRHAAAGIAVIGLHQRQHAVLCGLAAQVVILQGHLHRHFHAHRAAVGEEHVFEPGRRDPHQLAGQPVGGLVGEPAQHHVAQGVRLFLDGGHQAWMRVAMDHAPPGTGGVEQRLAAFEEEARPFAAEDLGRGSLGEQMGIGMPDGGSHQRLREG